MNTVTWGEPCWDPSLLLQFSLGIPSIHSSVPVQMGRSTSSLAQSFFDHWDFLLGKFTRKYNSVQLKK